jgi:2-keto-3-deoxy-L-rhamnonate aldolase RhmA
LQAENAEAVKNISDIVKVAGVDAILVGPYDLSASMGKMGQVQDAEIQSAIAVVAESCHANGLPPGIFVDSAESAAPYIQQGFSLIAISTDCLHMARAAREELMAIKQVD